MDKIINSEINQNISENIISLLNKSTYSIYVEESEFVEKIFEPLIKYGFEYGEIAELIDLRFNTITSMLLKELLESETQDKTINKLIAQGCTAKEAASIVSVSLKYILKSHKPAYVTPIIIAVMTCTVLSILIFDNNPSITGIIFVLIVFFIFYFKLIANFINDCIQYKKIKSIINKILK